MASKVLYPIVDNCKEYSLIYMGQCNVEVV